MNLELDRADDRAYTVVAAVDGREERVTGTVLSGG
ncbi:hypothetical protein HD596_000395 [Nonomuraea jabiensis]|uniref:Uncharacterized protein n=1 Tax=Nonomuraea jabiensis TaxID=882448 RepID=A0A7W9L7P4_9ACTN|nr:hypothetical protein [Nonomuraea jabiensis]